MIKDYVKVASTVDGIERGVVHFGKLLFEYDEHEFIPISVIRRHSVYLDHNKRIQRLNQAYSEYKHSLTFRVWAVCCYSNETCAPIANLPNSAQLGGTLYHSPKLHPGPYNVGMRRGTDTDARA